jgi:neurotransmitter:Na+ symporter, NSS family
MAKRENWGTRVGFVLAAIGSAVGLGNIWRFPYLTYSNGGGAFLIPYFIALFTAGIPIIILEMSIGHRFKLSPPSAFLKMSKKASWIGWLQVFIAFTIAIYYSVIVAWALKYTIFSFSLSWGEKTKDFFYNSFLHISSGPMVLGGIIPGIAVFTVLIWVFVWLTLTSGIRKGIEIIVKIFMPILFIGLILLLIRVVTLEGASNGLNWLFKPDFSNIYSFKTWAAAYGQVFFSLSICFGIMIAYSSYLPDKSDITNNATLTAFINCGFSILSAIVIFSVLGYAAHAQNVPLNEVAGGGIGLAFITIPLAVNLMPASRIVGILFFFALFVAGFTSVISIVEVCCSTIADSYKIVRKKAVTIFCIIGCILSLLFTAEGGLYALDIVDYFINNFGIVFAGIFELIFIAWFFKLGSFVEHINKTSDFHIGLTWRFLVGFFVPLFLGYMAIGNLISNINAPYENYPLKAITCYGWSLIVIVIILSFIMPLTVKTDKSLERKIK